MATSRQILANNLKFLMAYYPDLSTQPKLEAKSGVGQTTIGRILRNDTEAKIDTVLELAKAFRLGVGDLLDSGLIERLTAGSNISGTNGAVGRVPLISWVTAGMMCEVIDNFSPGDADDWLESPFPHGKHTYCLKIRGDSMWPDYKDGEIIQIDPEVAARHGDDVIARTPDGKASFKRLQEDNDGQYLLALNPDFPDRIIRVPEGTLVCGVCTGSWMDRRRK